jgi:hypothetical protein
MTRREPNPSRSASSGTATAVDEKLARTSDVGPPGELVGSSDEVLLGNPRVLEPV